jgi:hypothetical protein
MVLWLAAFVVAALAAAWLISAAAGHPVLRVHVRYR